MSDLIFFFKSKVGLVTTDLRTFLCTFKPRYRTRNYDPNNYYLSYVHNQYYYRHSYFIRTAELWNSSPSEVKSLTSLNLFKTAFSIFMFLRDQVIPLRVRIQVIFLVFCSLNAHNLVFFYLHLFFTFSNFYSLNIFKYRG